MLISNRIQNRTTEKSNVYTYSARTNAFVFALELAEIFLPQIKLAVELKIDINDGNELSFDLLDRNDQICWAVFPTVVLAIFLRQEHWLLVSLQLILKAIELNKHTGISPVTNLMCECH